MFKSSQFKKCVAMFLAAVMLVTSAQFIAPASLYAAPEDVSSFSGQINSRTYDMAFGRPAMAHTATGAGAATNALNHNMFNSWIMSNTPAPGWMVVDLGDLGPGNYHYFDTVLLSFFNGHRFNNSHLQVSDYRGPMTAGTMGNAATWTTNIWNYGLLNHEQLVQFDTPVRTARYVRFLVSSINVTGGSGLRLFQIYNLSTHPQPDALMDAILNPPIAHAQAQLPEVVNAQIVYPREDGTLGYSTFLTANINYEVLDGNRMPDFSRVGFMAGDEQIPFITSYIYRIYPSGGDDTALIQAAINHVGSQPPDANGFRGVVELAPGTFIISGSRGVLLNRSGVVLRGSGQGQDGTILLHRHRNTGWGRAATVALTIGAGSSSMVTGARTPVLDRFYPMGNWYVEVADASAFGIDDRIFVSRAATQAWTNFMRVYAGVQWSVTETNTMYERIITDIIQQEPGRYRIYLDTPLVMPLNIPLEATSEVIRIAADNRVMNVGVENLRIVADIDYFVEGERNSITPFHADTGILVVHTRDAFVRDVTAVGLSNSFINLMDDATNITVLNNSNIHPFGLKNSPMRYIFCVDDGRNSLFEGNYSQEARYDFVTGSRIGGPIVFLDGVGENNTDRGPQTHHRWATGILFDNIRMIGGWRGPVSENRGAAGTGHGYSGAGVIFWNNMAPLIRAAQPPTSRNMIIGVSGIYDTHPNPVQVHGPIGTSGPGTQAFRNLVGDTLRESTHNTVNPGSLFRAQAAVRHTGYYGNALPNRPLLQRPMPDAGVPQTFVISGQHDRDATEVTLFVNGVPRNVPIGNAANRFEFNYEITLTPGYHTISTTQVVRGLESSPTAQRTVNVRNADGSHNPTPSSFVFNAYTASPSRVFADQPATLYEIPEITPVTDLPNGTVVSQTALLLPSRVPVVITRDSDAMLLNQDVRVIWDLGSITGYDPSLVTAQTFYVRGELVLPRNVSQGAFADLYVYISITVNAQTELVSIGSLAPVVDLPSGILPAAIVNHLPATVALTVADGTPATGSIVWDIATATPPYDPGHPYAQTFTVTGEVTLPTHVTNYQGVPLTVTVDVTVLHRVALASIASFAPIYGLPNGTPRTAEALGLPTTVELTMAHGVASMSVPVTWNVLGSDYRPWLTTEQTFTVTGSFALPGFVQNPNNIPLTVTIQVTVEADTATINRVLVDIDRIWVDFEQATVDNPAPTGHAAVNALNGQRDGTRWAALVGSNGRDDSTGISSTCPTTGVRSVNFVIPLMYEYVLDSFQIGFWMAPRNYVFNIYHSMDGENWTRAQLGGDAVPIVYTRSAAITPVPVNAYTVPAITVGDDFRIYNVSFAHLTTANYIRLTGYGHATVADSAVIPGATISGVGDWFVVNYLELNGSRTLGEPSHQLTLADNRWSIITEATFNTGGSFVEPGFDEDNQLVIARMGSDASHAAPANVILATPTPAGPQNALSHNGNNRFVSRNSTPVNSGAQTVINDIRTTSLVADFGGPAHVESISFRLIDGGDWTFFNVFGSNDGENWSPIPIREHHGVYAVNLTSAFHYSTPATRHAVPLAPEAQFPAHVATRSSTTAQCEVTTPTVLSFEHTVLAQYVKITSYGTLPAGTLPTPDENGVRHLGPGTGGGNFDWFNVNSFRAFGQEALNMPAPPDEPVTGVALNETELEITVGATAALVATVLPYNATNRNVEWSSSNASVATVSQTGVVTAVAAGTATITVTTVDGEFTATAEVTVTQAPVVENANWMQDFGGPVAWMASHNVAQVPRLFTDYITPAGDHRWNANDQGLRDGARHAWVAIDLGEHRPINELYFRFDGGNARQRAGNITFVFSNDPSDWDALNCHSMDGTTTAFPVGQNLRHPQGILDGNWLALYKGSATQGANQGLLHASVNFRTIPYTEFSQAPIYARYVMFVIDQSVGMGAGLTTGENQQILAWHLFGPATPVVTPSDDATLEALTVDGVNALPYAADEAGFAHNVANNVTSVTIAATTTCDDASFAVSVSSPATFDAETGVVSGLPVGETTITVTVTAEDGIATRDYTIIVTRATAPVDGPFTLTLENFSPPGMTPQEYTHTLDAGETLNRIVNGFGLNQHGGIIRGGEVITDGWVRNFQLRDWVVVSPQDFELGGTAWLNRTVTMPDSNVTLQGDWEQHGGRYAIITFNANSGEFYDGETEVEKRSRVHEYWVGGSRPFPSIATLNTLAPAPEKAGGYTFVGWSTTNDGDVLSPGTLMDAPKTLYAIWVGPPRIVDVTPNPVTVHQDGTAEITVVTENMPAGAWVELNVAWRPGLSVVGGPRFYIGEDGTAVVTIAAAANAPLGQDGFGLAARVADQWGASVILDSTTLVITVVEPPTPAIVEVIPNPVTIQRGSTVEITVVTEHMPVGAWIDANVAWHPGLSVVGGPRFYVDESGLAVITLAAAADAQLGSGGFSVVARTAGEWGSNIIVDSSLLVINVIL